jgi:hypothetical protein
MKLLSAYLFPVFLAGSLSLQAGQILFRAVASGDIEKIKGEIAAGESIDDLDENGWTPLMWAIQNEQRHVVRWLLENGARTDIRSKLSVSKIPKGSTALSLAAFWGQELSIAELLRAKANPEDRDANGRTPLEIATSYKWYPCMARLQGKSPLRLPEGYTSAKQLTLEDVFILLDSQIYNSQPFLKSVQAALAKALEARKIRHFIFIVDPLDPDSGKAYRERLAEFKPRFVLDWMETAGTVRTTIEGWSRYITEFHVDLSLAGNPHPFWSHNLQAFDSSRVYGTGVAFQTSVSELIDHLKTDRLME